jgi:hypothetical protein
LNTIIELLTRVLCDSLPNQSVDGAYLSCTTLDNQSSVFPMAKLLIDQSLAAKTLILDSKAISGYPGVDLCREKLIKIGLKPQQIQFVSLKSSTSLNTLIESQALIRFAKECAFNSLIVVSPPFHQLRTFMTAVTVALQEYPDLAIYSCPGKPLPWLESVIHSQGILKAPRRELIREELVRIRTYQDKSDIAKCEDIIDYLAHRDSRMIAS